MSVTIHDLARLAGRNASTVSRALRNDPRVKPETRELIRRLAEREGYVPNLTARNLAAGSTGMVWLVLSSLDSDLERFCAKRLSLRFAAAGRELLLVVAGNSADRFRSIAGRLRQRLTDGAIIIAPSRGEEAAAALSELPVPILFLDRRLTSCAAPTVTTDNTGALQELAERCIGAGADFFFVDFLPDNSAGAERLNAARALASAAGRKCFTDPAAFRNWAERHPEQTPGLLGDSDEATLRRFAPQPELCSRSVGGFFDHASEGCRGKLKKRFTCLQDFELMSDRAAMTMLELIAGGKAPAPLQKIRHRAVLEG